MKIKLGEYLPCIDVEITTQASVGSSRECNSAGMVLPLAMSSYPSRYLLSKLIQRSGPELFLVGSIETWSH